MAEVNPNVPQAVDPEVLVDLTRLLRIRGPLGVLNVLDTIVPVVSLGDVVTRTVTVLQPAFRSTDVFSNGQQVNQAINTILADTGPLPEGVYDVLVQMASDSSTALASIAMEHRDAANAVNLAIWDHILQMPTADTRIWPPYTFAYELALNERLRLRQTVAGTAARVFEGVIFARIR